MNGLEKAIKKVGTASNLATLLGIKPMSVSRWKNRYKGVVPHDRVYGRNYRQPGWMRLAELCHRDSDGRCNR